MKKQITISPEYLAEQFNSAADGEARVKDQWAQAGRTIAENINLKGGRQLVRDAIRLALVSHDNLRASLEDSENALFIVSRIGRTDLETASASDVLLAAKNYVRNRKDSMLKGIRFALKSAGYSLELGKEQSAEKKSITLLKIPASPSGETAKGNDQTNKPNPTGGKVEGAPINVEDTDESTQVAAMVAAFRNLSADSQDAVMVQLTQILGERPTNPAMQNAMAAAKGKGKGSVAAAASH